MKILAVKQEGRTGEDSDFKELDLIDEINCINLTQKTKNSAKVLAFHTTEGIYLPLTTISDIAKICDNYGFEVLGDAVVNSKKIDKVKAIDNNGTIITFIDGKSVKVKKQI